MQRDHDWSCCTGHDLAALYKFYKRRVMDDPKDESSEEILQSLDKEIEHRNPEFYGVKK